MGDAPGEKRETKRNAYGCPHMDTPLVLPSSSFIGMTVYDFDSGVLGDYTEILGVPLYAYFVTGSHAALYRSVPGHS